MYRETWKLYWVVIYRRDKISEKIMNKSLVYQYMTINCRVFHLIRVGCIFCQYFNNKSPIFGAIVFWKNHPKLVYGPQLIVSRHLYISYYQPYGPQVIVSHLAQHFSVSQAGFQFSLLSSPTLQCITSYISILRKIKFQSVMEGFEPKTSHLKEEGHATKSIYVFIILLTYVYYITLKLFYMVFQ